MINLFVANNYHKDYLCIYKIWTWISLNLSKSKSSIETSQLYYSYKPLSINDVIWHFTTISL